MYVKGFVVTANYQDVTPGLLLTVADYMDSLKPSYARDSIDHAAMEMLRRAASYLASKSARDAEAAELEALGGTEAAERGWNALRRHNPKVDRSTGKSESDDIHVFADLPHRQKVNYAVFAAGVLDVKREPMVFSSTADEPPLGVDVLSGNGLDGPAYLRRTGSGWWWVRNPGTEPCVEGWPWKTLASHNFPLTEVIS